MAHRRWPNRILTIACVLSLAVLMVTACGGKAAPGAKVSPSERDALIQQAATQYARDGNLPKAQETIAKLNLANPSQFVITLAEQAVNDRKPAGEIAALARLAEALGGRSPKLVAYLSPTATPAPPPAPANTAVLPSPTVAPTATPSPPAATAVPPTATAAATTPAQKPRVVADSTANLRGGPGTNYPMIGQITPGKEADIIGRNANGDWWRIAWDGAGQAWIAGLVVRVLGPIDTVAVVKDIPAPPPTNTPAPPTAPPPPTEPPKPSTAFVVKSLRMRALGEGAQRCDGGDHNIFIVVVDKGGNPLDGVRVREIFSNRVIVTGSQGKGTGRAEYDIYRGGGGQIEIVDDANNRISEVSRGMSDDWPAFDLLRDAGYCQCKPWPDDASCEAGLKGKAYQFFPIGHYVYEVVFQRTY